MPVSIPLSIVYMFTEDLKIVQLQAEFWPKNPDLGLCTKAKGRFFYKFYKIIISKAFFFVYILLVSDVPLMAKNHKTNPDQIWAKTGSEGLVSGAEGTVKYI